MTEGANQRELVFVVGCDDRYAIALAVTLHTALSRLDSMPTRVVVVDGGMSSESRARIQRVISSAAAQVSVTWHIADPKQFSGLKVSKWGSTANYLRLLIPEIVDPEVDVVVYLDSDLLVRADVSVLAVEARRDPKPIHAVGDYHHRVCESVFGAEGCRKAGIDPTAPYFNSGVMTIDVQMWRNDQIPQRAINFVREHADVMRHSDQDALNAILPWNWSPLDVKWNVMIPSIGRYLSQELDDGESRRKQRKILMEEAHIFHFTGARKPWLPGYLGPKGFEYRKALRRSSWFHDRREWLSWSLRFWLRSPAGWVREGYRRARKRAALAYRRIRPVSDAMP